MRPPCADANAAHVSTISRRSPSDSLRTSLYHSGVAISERRNRVTATPKPPWSHPQAIWWPTGRYPEATLRLPRGYPKATPRLPQSYPKATRKPDDSICRMARYGRSCWIVAGVWSRARWYRVYLDSFAVANHDLAQDSRPEKRQNARLGGTGLESTYAIPELQVVCRRL